VPVRVEELAAVPVFAMLSSAELGSLAASAERMEVAAAAELAREGDSDIQCSL
jgi:hypothetical protein